MSFAVMGLTHCARCMSPLDMSEFYICKSCQEKEDKEKEKKAKIEEEKQLYNKIDKYIEEHHLAKTECDDKSILVINTQKPQNISYDEWYADIGFKIISNYNKGIKNISIEFIDKAGDDNE